MKKLLITAVLLTASTLTACQKMKSENVMYSLTTNEEDLVQIDAKTLEYMIKNEFNLNVLMYTENCSYCERALESAKEEQNRLKCLIYKIEMDQSIISYLSDVLPSFFTKDEVYPSMWLFKEGKISYKIDYNNLQHYKSLNRVLYPQLYTSKMIVLVDPERFEYALNDATTALLYTYDSSKVENNAELVKKVFNVSTKPSDYFTVFIDKNSAKSGLISKFYDYCGLTDDGEFDYLMTIEKGQRKTTVRYLSADGNQIDNLLESIL